MPATIQPGFAPVPDMSNAPKAARRAADFLFGGSIDLTRAHLPEFREELAADIARETGLADLLAYAERMANHTSGNLHGFYSAEIQAARAAVLKAGGTLRAVGRYREGEALPMSLDEYAVLKHKRRMAAKS
jgi:hypothetical protein